MDQRTNAPASRRPDAASVSKDALLVEAAECGNMHTVERLLRDGADISYRDLRGRTALLAATHANRIESARLLVAAGADANAKDLIDDSPYLYAGACGHLKILEMLLPHGADLRSTNRYGGTALIPAAERGHVETVRRLIEAGVDVDHVNRLGWTALLEAVILGDGGERHQAIVRLLLDGGANPGLADSEGVTPFEHARRLGHHAIKAMLQTAPSGGGKS